MTHSNTYPFKTRPYAHQSEAWERSRSQSEYALFMEMGTGKSKVIVDNIAYLYDTGRIDTAIIVAPKGVYRNWINSELPTHMPDHVKYTTAVWSSTPKKEEAQALEAIRFPSHDLRILVVNVEAFSTKRAVQWLDKFMLVSGKVFMCVDESTTIKNPTAARTKSLIKIGRQAHYRRILTGEPVTRSPMDLYSQCQFLDPALLGFSSYYSFRSRYAIMVDMKAGARSFKKVVGFQRLDELSDMIKSFSFRCKKDECLDLPDKIYQYRYVEMTKDQKKAYNDVSKMAFTKIDGEILTADNVLTQMLRLHQITCGHIKTDEGVTLSLDSGRLTALMETLEETPDKVIIWANYIADIAAITGAIGKEYGDESLVSYYGGTSDEDRQTAIKRFQEDPSCRFFIGNPQTGGMGITLTAANTVVYYSNSYNLEHRLQSEDRAHRIGQKNNVVYVDLVCQGTVDEKIVKALRAKKQVATQVMGDEWREWLKPV
jgi:SNF2 family DNA or RNA helicase